MKRFLLLYIAVIASMSCLVVDHPVTYEQLPVSATEFINTHFPASKVSFVFEDDDLLCPDYTVRLDDGTEIEFNHDGSLEKVESKSGLPVGLIPVQIVSIVNTHYQDPVFVEYEVGRRSFEVKLSNGLEMTFNRNFNLVEVDN